MTMDKAFGNLNILDTQKATHYLVNTSILKIEIFRASHSLLLIFSFKF